jgi:hypothetical protein
MIHLLEGEWAITKDLLKVDCKNLYSLIKLRKLVSQEINVSSIGYKELDSIDKENVRYKLADCSYPIIVATMENPKGKQYRLIDGRHRILKHINNGVFNLKAYVLDKQDILKFVEKYG